MDATADTAQILANITNAVNDTVTNLFSQNLFPNANAASDESGSAFGSTLGIGGYIVEAFVRLGDYIFNFLATVANYFTEGYYFLYNGLSNVALFLQSGLYNLGVSIYNVMATLYNFVTYALKTIFEIVVSIINTIYIYLVSMGNDLISKAASSFTGVVNQFRQKIALIVFADAFTVGAWNGLNALFTGDKSGDLFDVVGKSIKSVLKAVGPAILASALIDSGLPTISSTQPVIAPPIAMPASPITFAILRRHLWYRC